MLFNSFDFGFFFLGVTTLYFALPFRMRVPLLLVASMYFYMAFVPVFILVLAATIVVDYFAGIWIESQSGSARKALLLVSIVANVSVLALFKYFDFLSDNLTALYNLMTASTKSPYHWGMILPIGLSFHTFQAMSYTVEVYRGNQKAERNFLVYALYVMFYPQLVAGPIERPQNVLHQFLEEHRFEVARASSGLKLMAWGFFKKCVIADRVAMMVDRCYDSPQDFSGGGYFIWATLFFAIQIYCDFSGYSDIAIGCARVMGIDLMKNFNHPYFAASLSDFWRRWHISLSTWFRDYLYFPLGGSRVRPLLSMRNLMITFLVSGLWHGANWTYIIWGGINGAFLILEAFAAKKLVSKYRLPWRVVTLLFILVTWIFFRSQSLSDAWYILSHLGNRPISSLREAYVDGMGALQFDWLVALLAITVFFIVEWLEEKQGRRLDEILAGRSAGVRVTFYYFLVLSVVLLGVVDSSRQFIYFQF